MFFRTVLSNQETLGLFNSDFGLHWDVTHAICKVFQISMRYLSSKFTFTCSSFLQCLRFWHDTDPISVSFIFSEPLERAKEPDQLAIRSLSATKHGNVTIENASHDEIQGSCQQLIDDINAKRKRDTDLLNGRVKILNILILCLINDYTVLICHGCFAIFLI